MSDKGQTVSVRSSNGSASGPTVAEALQYADGLPADCWADRCIIELAAEVKRLRAWCDQVGEENDFCAWDAHPGTLCHKCNCHRKPASPNIADHAQPGGSA